VAWRLVPELPDPQHTVSLREVGRWVNEKLLVIVPAESEPKGHAAVLNDLSLWQHALGQREAALASAQQALEIRSKLASFQPEAILPDVASSLNILAAMQSGLGQHQAALASAELAVDIRRKLSASRPEVFLRQLAGSLNNLSNTQREIGQREAALASAEEAVGIYR